MRYGLQPIAVGSSFVLKAAAERAPVVQREFRGNYRRRDQTAPSCQTCTV